MSDNLTERMKYRDIFTTHGQWVLQCKKVHKWTQCEAQWPKNWLKMPQNAPKWPKMAILLKLDGRMDGMAILYCIPWTIGSTQQKVT